MKTSQKLQINTEMWLPSYQMKKLKENNNISGWDRMLKTKPHTHTHTYSWTLSRHHSVNPFRPSAGFTTLPLHFIKPGSIKHLHRNPCVPTQNTLCPETFSHMMHSKVRTIWWQTRTCYFFCLLLFLRRAQAAIGTKSTPKTKQSGMELWLPK